MEQIDRPMVTRLVNDACARAGFQSAKWEDFGHGDQLGVLVIRSDGSRRTWRCKMVNWSENSVREAAIEGALALKSIGVTANASAR